MKKDLIKKKNIKPLKVSKKTSVKAPVRKSKIQAEEKKPPKKNKKVSTTKQIDYSKFGYNVQRYHSSFKGLTLKKYFKAEEVENRKGKFLLIRNESDLNLPVIDRSKAIEKIRNQLTIIDGIAEIKQRDLQSSGYRTVTDLLSHSRLATKAKEFIGLLDSHDGHSMYHWLKRRKQKYGPATFSISGFFNHEDFAVVDIETLGFSSPVFLIGMGYIQNENFCVDQYFARNLDEEAALLHHLGEVLKTRQALITYNGASFDVPLIKQRSNIHGVDLKWEKSHFDMYHYSKKAFSEVCYDFRLTTIESIILGHRRKADISGFVIPSFYQRYSRSGNIGTVVPIIDHNRQDILSTFKIFDHLHLKWDNC